MAAVSSQANSDGDHATTAYDAVPYPSAIFRQAQHDRLAVVARLHGLDAPPVATARVLDIAGGDGLNAMALAAAFPDAQFVNFDLAPTAIERGRDWAAKAGLGNVRHEILDILDAADRLEGQFDYIVAHGIYAWVPRHVRAAIFPLIAKLLAPNGVAMVSYNALPGGYSRLALRGLLMNVLDRTLPPSALIEKARAFLDEFAKPEEHDEPIVQAMRREAEVMLKRPVEVIFHDELGGAYFPQALADVAADARASGLAYLNEAGKSLLAHGFWAADETPSDEAALVRRMTAQDFLAGRYFRNSLFVRADAPIRRDFDAGRLLGLSAAGFVVEHEPGTFKGGNVTVDIRDEAMASAMRQLSSAWPDRMPVAELSADADHREALFRLAVEGMIDFHTVPAPFAVEPGKRPTASPLVRMQIAEGQRNVATLEHRTVAMADERARTFVSLLDGSRDRAALARDWAASGHAEAVTVDDALALIARQAVLLPDRPGLA